MDAPKNSKKIRRFLNDIKKQRAYTSKFEMNCDSRLGFVQRIKYNFHVIVLQNNDYLYSFLVHCETFYNVNFY